MCFRLLHPFFHQGGRGLAGRSTGFISGKCGRGLSMNSAVCPSGDIPSPAQPWPVQCKHPQTLTLSSSCTAHTLPDMCVLAQLDTRTQLDTHPPDPFTWGQPPTNAPCSPDPSSPHHFRVIKVLFEGVYNFYLKIPF